MPQKHIPLFAAGRSECGNVRAENEDALNIDSPLFVVADGIGGGPKGEVASRMAVEIISRQVQSRVAQDPGAASTALIGAIKQANRAIYEKSMAEQDHCGMGTTVVAANVVGNLVFIAHVGDSRAYCWKSAPSALHLLTRDHTVRNDPNFAGMHNNMTTPSAGLKDWLDQITRSLGNRPEVKVDLNIVTLDPGDALLLCTDGLTNMVTDDEIARAFRECRTPQEIVNALINAALENGGGDNVTVVICGFGESYRPSG